MQRVLLSTSCIDSSGRVRAALASSANWRLIAANPPDFRKDGVLVLDQRTFLGLRGLLPRPERVVLLAEKDPAIFKLAWNAGIHSVILETDSNETLRLAMQAAALRESRRKRRSRPEIAKTEEFHPESTGRLAHLAPPRGRKPSA